MKRLLLLLSVVALCSCGGDVQVMYEDGQVENADNSLDMKITVNDTLIMGTNQITGKRFIYGKYVGTVPEEKINSSGYNYTFKKAVVIKD